jgi:ParB family chromosome partitioning protein
MTRRSGLGRGLDALIPTVEERQQEGSPLLEASVEVIDPNPNQPRENFDDDEIAELASSITELGVLQPLLVRGSSGGRYELIAGERRLRASRAAGLDVVPVIVVDTDERGSLERALVENVHRSDLNPVEEASAYRDLLDQYGLTHDALAQRVGKSRVAISNALRLLELPTSIQRLLVDRRLTAGHGKALMALQGSPFMERLARRSADEGLSVRETEELVRRYQEMSTATSSKSATAHSRPPEVSEAQRVLSDVLQTRVRVDVGKRKGRIVLDFVSLEELSRLLGIITGRTEGAETTVASLEDQRS